MRLRKEFWEKRSLGEIATIIMGQSPPSSTYNLVEEGLPFFQGKTEFTNKHPVPVKWCSKPNKIAEPNDILITVRAPVGSTNTANQKCCIGRGIAAIRSSQNIDYILYFLQSIEKELSLKGTGTIFGGISGKILSDLKIPMPSLEEQQIVVSLFKTIEASIEHVEVQEKNLILMQKHLIEGLLKTEPKFGNKLNYNNTHTVSFGNIVDCVEHHDKKRNGVTRFIGLEDIRSDSFLLETWGNIGDGTTFTKRFYKGDILFGKRRPYLRKVAVSDFDGICSGDILVFRAKKEKILPELLPFYVSSEDFIQHAVKTSAGSLSPRTKWKDLKEFKFKIPDLQTQSVMMEIFAQIQKTSFQVKDQKTILKNLKQSLLNEILG
jgi:type I restriction enzyme S subunit